MKGRAASQIQPYVEDYLLDLDEHCTRADTQTLFKDQKLFKEEIGRIFREVDAKSQAKRAISYLRQMRSIVLYITKFKQLQAKINQDNIALRIAFYNSLKDSIKDRLIYYKRLEELYKLIKLTTRINNQIQEQTYKRGHLYIANTSHR